MPPNFRVEFGEQVMKTIEIIGEAGFGKTLGRQVAGAAKAGLTGQNMRQGAINATDAGEASDMVDAETTNVLKRWTQKTAANPNAKTDKELHAFILQWRKVAPASDFPAPTPGTATNPGKTKQYIRDLVAAELSASEFGMRTASSNANEPAAEQPPEGGNSGSKLEPGQQGTKEVTTQDPKLLPIGTQFTDTQNSTYKWEGQQWTMLGKDGTWQGGQIKNKIAWDLYLQAINQGKALAPISAKPDPAMAAKAEPTQPGAATTDSDKEAPAGPSTEFKQVSDWVAKQNKTTVQSILKQLEA
jgi:hypothetical protein